MRPAPTAVGASLALTLLVASVCGGDIPDAVVALETSPGTPGSDSTGAPPRFVLLKDGRAFVGGTSRIETVQLEKDEASALRRRVDAARKAIGRERSVALGAGGKSVRLRFGIEPPVEVILGPGEPLPADPVSSLVAELLAFLHPALVPYTPQGYEMRLREGVLPGGCRRWNFAFALEPSVGATRVVTVAQAEGWPTGALPASVCGEGDKRYVLTLRPLLPGEQP